MDTCKICGASRDPLNTNCKFCGTAYQISTLTGDTYINALRTILNNIDKEELNSKSAGSQIISQLTGKKFARLDAKISAISTFAMPTDIDNIIQFFSFCHGNAQMAVAVDDDVGERLKGAWFGKAKMAFLQLQIKSYGNHLLAQFIKEYDLLYGSKAKKPFSFKTLKAYLKTSFIVIPILYILIILVAAVIEPFILDSREKSEKDRLTQEIATVQRFIELGQLDAAEIACEKVRWNRTIPGRSDTLEKQYENIRDLLLTQIMERKKGQN
jgi:hypothetical protein